MKHPLDEVFGIQSINEPEIIDAEHTANGMVPAEDTYVMTTAQAANPQGYQDDDEDKAISAKIDDIYDKALGAFEEQTAYIQMIEPRYAARNAEVAANYLNTALNAVALRARVKNEKRKASSAFVPYKHGGGSAANIVVADRNEILRMMAEGNGPIIDGGR
jgi:hypothetical protein